jgi:hypothetical protein
MGTSGYFYCMEQVSLLHLDFSLTKSMIYCFMITSCVCLVNFLFEINWLKNMDTFFPQLLPVGSIPVIVTDAMRISWVGDSFKLLPDQPATRNLSLWYNSAQLFCMEGYCCATTQ